MFPVVLLSTVAFAQDSPPRVLFLGNSYTFYNDLQLRVAELMESSVPALDRVEGARLAAGGLRLPDHVDRVDRGDTQWVDALTGAPGRWTWMVLQDQSQIPGFPETETYWQASADAVTTLDGYALAQEAETVLFMTWGRRDGDSTNPSMYPDFETMNARLDAGYRSYATHGSAPDRTLWIAPAGRAFGAVYDRLEAEGIPPEDAGTDFHQLYDGDGSHPSAVGSALVAGVFVRTLTGFSPTWDSAPAGVDAADLPWIADAVDASVVPFADLPYPWAVDHTDYTVPDDVSAAGWVVSGRQMCTTVGVAAVVEDVETATVGALHDGVPGCGRLWMLDGGALSVETVAVDAGALGELVVQGGQLTVGAVAVPLTLAGGEASVGGDASQPIAVEAGTLTLVPGMSGTSLSMTGGTLALTAATDSGAALGFSDTVSLAGSLAIGEPSTTPAYLLSAPGILLDDALETDLPEGWRLEVQAGAGGVDVLTALDDSAGGDDGGSTGDDSGTDDGGMDDGGMDEESPEGTTSSSSGRPSDDKGSGCAATGSAMGGLALTLWAVAGRRRKPPTE